MPHFTDAHGRINLALEEHEVGRTARDVTQRMHALVSQLTMVRDPFVLEDIRRELRELDLAMQRLRTTLDRLSRHTYLR